MHEDNIFDFLRYMMITFFPLSRRLSPVSIYVWSKYKKKGKTKNKKQKKKKKQVGLPLEPFSYDGAAFNGSQLAICAKMKKSTFLTCPCHKTYRVEAVGLKNFNYT